MSKALSMNFFLLILSTFVLLPLLTMKPKVLVRHATRDDGSRAILTATTQEGSSAISSGSSQLMKASVSSSTTKDEKNDSKNPEQSAVDLFLSVLFYLTMWAGVFVTGYAVILILLMLVPDCFGALLTQRIEMGRLTDKIEKCPVNNSLAFELFC